MSHREDADNLLNLLKNDPTIEEEYDSFDEFMQAAEDGKFKHILSNGEVVEGIGKGGRENSYCYSYIKYKDEYYQSEYRYNSWDKCDDYDTLVKVVPKKITVTEFYEVKD